MTRDTPTETSETEPASASDGETESATGPDLKMEAWWAALIRRAAATRENATRYDGFLSYSTEFHALGMGFAVGFGSVAPLPADLKLALAGALGVEELVPRKLFGSGANEHVAAEIRKEPWYAITGIFIGFVLSSLWTEGHNFAVL